MVRDDVLRTLEEHRGEQISGGTLARKLGVYRTAIWKAVSSLREMGFPITSAAGGGYCLDESSDALSEAGISMNLTTRYAAQHLCVLSTVDSTNNYLKQRAADLPHGYAAAPQHPAGTHASDDGRRRHRRLRGNSGNCRLYAGHQMGQ